MFFNSRRFESPNSVGFIAAHSPDYSSNQPNVVSGGPSKKTASHDHTQPPSKSTSSSTLSPHRRRHHNSGTGPSTAADTVPLVRGGSTSASTASDFIFKRSASAILCGAGIGLSSIGIGGAKSDNRSSSSQQRQQSSFGSGLHLGSSVTFCNTLGRGPNRSGATLFPNDADSAGMRRSCSITLAYPSDSVLQQGPASGTGVNVGRGPSSAEQNGSCMPTSMRRDGSGRQVKADNSSRLALMPPVITYDGVTTAPTSPTAGPDNDGRDRRDLGGGSGSVCGSTANFGSSYQLQTSRSKNVLVTPRGSFLTINQSPIEFRESMLSISYPNYVGQLA